MTDNNHRNTTATLDESNDVIISVDLSEVPEEVTNYAGDQLRDRCTKNEMLEATGRVFGGGGVHRDYDEHYVVLHRTVLTELFYRTAQEKIRGIEWEVEHDERHDFTYDDVRRARRALDAAFDSAETKIGLSAFPEEVVTYGFEILQERIGEWEEIKQARDQVENSTGMQWDYDEQRLEFTTTIVTHLLYESLAEAETDLESNHER
ncbi:hypothetical protein [Salinibaculum rarum]|uniref:hypothetical protein n=1 Tax=Salinibaculum rarum TaxID=3058903 RepID=UPI00265DC291|nr:hypothetical protein [Salinibaculum sp. KK48]